MVTCSATMRASQRRNAPPNSAPFLRTDLRRRTVPHQPRVVRSLLTKVSPSQVWPRARCLRDVANDGAQVFVASDRKRGSVPYLAVEALERVLAASNDQPTRRPQRSATQNAAPARMRAPHSGGLRPAMSRHHRASLKCAHALAEGSRPARRKVCPHPCRQARQRALAWVA